jgi:hypothetical protein
LNAIKDENLEKKGFKDEKQKRITKINGRATITEEDEENPTTSKKERGLGRRGAVNNRNYSEEAL